MIEELLCIANGDLIQILKREGIWKEEDPLKLYWNDFQIQFPALHETLTLNFQSRSITGTVAEQTFTLTSTQVRANNASCTNERNMMHATNIRGAFTREMKEFEQQHIGRLPPRQLRSKESKVKYINKLLRYGNELAVRARSDGILTLPTIVQMRGKGKKGSEIIEIFQHTQIEMAANAKKDQIQ